MIHKASGRDGLPRTPRAAPSPHLNNGASHARAPAGAPAGCRPLPHRPSAPGGPSAGHPLLHGQGPPPLPHGLPPAAHSTLPEGPMPVGSEHHTPKGLPWLKPALARACPRPQGTAGVPQAWGKPGGKAAGCCQRPQDTPLGVRPPAHIIPAELTRQGKDRPESRSWAADGLTPHWMVGPSSYWPRGGLAGGHKRPSVQTGRPRSTGAQGSVRCHAAGHWPAHSHALPILAAAPG